MKNIISKTATPLSLAVLLAMGSVSMTSQANEDKKGWSSNKHGVMLAFNSGVRGKPPYNRSKRHNQNRRQNIQSVEMSALEIDQNATQQVRSQIKRRKGSIGGHPNRAKRHNSNRF